LQEAACVLGLHFEIESALTDFKATKHKKATYEMAYIFDLYIKRWLS